MGCPPVPTHAKLCGFPVMHNSGSGSFSEVTQPKAKKKKNQFDDNHEIGEYDAE